MIAALFASHPATYSDDGVLQYLFGGGGVTDGLCRFAGAGVAGACSGLLA